MHFLSWFPFLYGPLTVSHIFLINMNRKGEADKIKRNYIKLFPQKTESPFNHTWNRNFIKSIFRITFTSFYQSSELKTDTWASLPLMSFGHFGACWEKPATGMFQVFGSDAPKPRRSPHTHKTTQKAEPLHVSPAQGILSSPPSLRLFQAPVAGSFLQPFWLWRRVWTDVPAGIWTLVSQQHQWWDTAHTDSSSATTEGRCSDPITGLLG